jgi:3',5'-cyclic-AMP phosphodiesterase
MLIYQITDPHIPQKGRDYIKSNFYKIIDYIVDNPPDFLVITGDFSYPGESESYQWVKDNLPKGIDSIIVPGNHDNGTKLYEIFKDTSSIINESFCFTKPLDKIDLVFANTSSGRLPDNNIELIMSDAIREGSVLFLHHPTAKLSEGFMDLNYQLEDIDRINSIISKSNIKHVFCGHFHTEYSIHSSYNLYVTPSPAFEINLHSREFLVEKTRVPLRIINVLDNKVFTEMKYLDE